MHPAHAIARDELDACEQYRLDVGRAVSRRGTSTHIRHRFTDLDAERDTVAVISVVVPAHNEAPVIGRLLSGLLRDAAPGEIEAVVVANGCTDDTASIAAGYGPAVTVLSTPAPSKFQAMRLADEHATGFPRLYVDADIELSTASVRALATELAEPGVLAVAPHRHFDLAATSLIVRMYYTFWQRLPVVRRELSGRGVIGVSEEGHKRLAALPEVMGDDLAASVAFSPAERRIVAGADVVVRTPRTVSDLIRRRVRAATVVAQMDHALPGAVRTARTSRADLLGVVRENPLLAAHLAVFLAITLAARSKARRAIRAGDYSTWLRDESSRKA